MNLLKCLCLKKKNDSSNERRIIAILYRGQIDQPELGINSRDYYMKGEDEPHMVTYWRYATDVAVLFGANQTLAEQDILDMIRFEMKLANVS